MKKQTTQIRKTRRTSIRISNHERLTFWRVPQGNENDVVLECPVCGHEIFWVEVDNTPDIELYEDTNNYTGESDGEK